MTPQEQRIAIAEACGWVREWADILTWNASLNDHKGDYEPVCTLLFRRMEKCFLAENLPDYLSDLNACHEAEKVLTDKQWQEYAIRLAGEEIGEGWPTCFLNLEAVRVAASATAAQRAEALLRAIGKWKQD